MQMRVKLFDGVEHELVLYNGIPLLNFEIELTIDEDCDGEDEDFVFDSFVSGSLRVYNERSGRLIRTIPVTQSDSSIVINTTNTTFEDNGLYYFDLTYIQSGGYEAVLMYGKLRVI